MRPYTLNLPLSFCLVALLLSDSFRFSQYLLYFALNLWTDGGPWWLSISHSAICGQGALGAPRQGELGAATEAPSNADAPGISGGIFWGIHFGHAYIRIIGPTFCLPNLLTSHNLAFEFLRIPAHWQLSVTLFTAGSLRRINSSSQLREWGPHWFCCYVTGIEEQTSQRNSAFAD